MKKLLIYLLAAVLVFSALPTAQAVDGVAINADNFPDKGFRQFVVKYDTDSNGTLSYSELKAVVEMELPSRHGYEIYSLEGIEHFSELVYISIFDNYLTSLDVSKNKKIQYISCGENRLTSLNTRGCLELKSVTCYRNLLSSLDFSTNTALEYISCLENKLTKLDISNNPNLEFLNCSNNYIRYLDLSKNPKLSTLYCPRNSITHITLVDGIEFSDEYSELDPDMPGPICKENGAKVFVDSENRFDIKRLPVGFETSRVLGASGATIDNDGIITFEEFGGVMTYYYGMNNEYYAEFYIKAAYRIGDVTGDGKMTAADASAILRHDVQLEVLPDELAKEIDINGDGTVNSMDAALILQYDVKLIA